MKLLIVTLCVLAALIPTALSIECYVCAKTDGNCESGKTKCSSLSSSSDTCMKIKTGDAVVKSCTTSSGCEAAKDICKDSGKCDVSCCDTNLCNGGVPLKSATFLTLLAMSFAVAKYVM